MAIVIDNGSRFIKTGFASDDAPRGVFSSAVGRGTMGGSGPIIGEGVLGKDAVIPKFPIKHGIVTDWDDMERLWQHAYDNELRVSPEEYNVLVTEKPFNNKPNREKTCQILFETFNAPAMYLASGATISLYTYGRISGLVIDCGYSVTHTVPCYEGYAINKAILRMDYGGEQLTSFMRGMLEMNGYAFHSNSQRHAIEDLKEQLCFVSSDYENENASERVYELPDGNAFSVYDEQFRCPEALFKPSLLGRNQEGIQELTVDSIMRTDSDIHGDLFGSIILTGGTSMLQGLDSRLQSEVSKQSRTPRNVTVKVFGSYPQRKYSAWIGGSILASLDTFEEMWLTKADYDEHGPRVIHTHCSN